MKSRIALLISTASLLLTFSAATVLNQGGYVLTPGLSGSFDYSDFKEVRESFLKTLLQILNNMTLPDFEFDGGYMKNNSLLI
jgi:hypothetical protein